jgi:hypothetical protein
MISRRNRKKRRMNGFMVPAPFAIVVVLVATISLGYVWLGCRCDSVGKELKALETQKAELEKRILNEEYKWTRMKSPGSIEEALTRFGIVMTWPGREQVVRLSDKAIPGNQPAGSGQYALKYASVHRAVLNE